MGLKESRILNEVNPWLADRLRWLAEVAGLLGSKQSLISGNRSLDTQRELYFGSGTRPVAFPGCSQHNYGFAADAHWLPAVQITSKARPRSFSSAKTFAAMEGYAQAVGLQTVAGDPGHLQMYHASQFRPWSVSRGFCNPNPPPRNPLGLVPLQFFPRLPVSFSGICVWGEYCDRNGCFCVDPFF